MFVRDAHSLYLEALGELGALGFLLIAGTFVAGVAVGVRRLRAAAGEERLVLAALLAAFLGYAVAVGIDWMWELTIVSVVGISLLGFLAGPATAASGRPRLLADAEPGERRSRRRFAAGVAAVAIGLAPDLRAGDPVPGRHQGVRQPGGGASRRRGAGALGRRHGAEHPAVGGVALPAARARPGGDRRARGRRGSIGEAIERDPQDWRLWLVAARLQAKAGDVAEARRSLARAAELNPRSPLFASVS